jgi:serine/threonine-protein kinase
VINTAACNAEQRSGCSQTTTTVPVGANPWALTVDQALHTVYVANRYGDTLSVINTSTCDAADSSGCKNQPPTSQVGTAPLALTVDPATGTVYVANFRDNTVSVIDAATCNVTRLTGCARPAATVHVGSAPTGVAIDQATDTVYVANSVDSSVLRKHPANGESREVPARDRRGPGHRHHLRHQPRCK